MAARCVLLFFVSLASLAFAPAPFPRPERPGGDSTDMTGVWEPDVGHQLLITSTRLTLSPQRGKDWYYDLKVDRTARPATFELRGVPNGASEGLHFKGIYRVRGGVLTMTYSEAEFGTPTAFAGFGRGKYVAVYKRVSR